MAERSVYIAGIGSSPWTWPRTSLSSLRTNSAVLSLAISAATKALLDAGLSYDNVDLALSSSALHGAHDVFYTFGKTGIPIHEIDDSSGLCAAADFIRSGNTHCILLISFNQSAATGIVVASEAFLWRHPYLKDSSIILQGYATGTPRVGTSTVKTVVREALRRADLGPTDISLIESNVKSALDDLEIPRNIQTWSADTNLHGICELVWLLRGWKASESSLQHCLQCSSTENGTMSALVLSRADKNAVPSFDEVKFKNDGRDRLGYNPALETRDITMEDWQAVKSRAELSSTEHEQKLRFRRKGGDRAALEKL